VRDARPRAERARLARGAVVEADAEGQEQVRLVEQTGIDWRRARRTRSALVSARIAPPPM
jgi:hypothetical protein